MRSSWPLILVLMLSVCSLMMFTEGASAVEATMEEDEYYVSVDPSDDNQGYLEIEGEVDPGDLGIGQSMTVTLTVEVHELKNGQPTGRLWDASIDFDDVGSTGGTKLFGSRDGPEGFTVTMDPGVYDPASPEDIIPIPPGIGEDTEGRVVVTVSYEGLNVDPGEVVAQTTIYPELYHLINMTTPDGDVSLGASDLITYNIPIKNAGNMEDSVVLEVPLLEYLDDLGFETSLSEDRFPNMLPGEKANSTLWIKAPLEIKRNENLKLVIHSYTEALDPETLEPASDNEIIINLALEKSKKEQPQPVDDDDDTTDDDDDGFEPNPSPGTDPVATEGGTETWIVVLIVGFIVVAILVIAAVFLRKGGGGEEEDISDAHDSTFRI